MGEVYWSITARRNLQDIGDFIAQDSPFYAVDFVERILQQTDKLADFPKIGRMVPEFQRETIRELIFHNYRIVYRVQGNRVIIVAVSHGSMDIRERAKREDWDV
ncbi:MAG: type II toxin-antitoxin system RelE/ParE family toxin [Chloroflexi bacterium CG07_land_8_20_14_0_80_51_10]|nr:MAG: type II toxin-antitoxin system RelE/ParE family toxin [Chloroflexi bacterium CG07_land_8_20_14_0_80_51_10]